MSATISRTLPDRTESEADLAERAVRINNRLREVYARHRPRTRRHPTDSLIATILSQHTADRNSHLAMERLMDRYQSWEEIAYADALELAGVIRPAGLANIKASRIRETLREIERRRGDMDLSFLCDLPLEEARRELESLPGVGPKTAACVLLFACDLPALPIDTHVHRVARRLGLIGRKTTAERAHVELGALVAAEDVYDFHVNLIAHGRAVCASRDPHCGECALQTQCAYHTNGVGEELCN